MRICRCTAPLKQTGNWDEEKDSMRICRCTAPLKQTGNWDEKKDAMRICRCTAPLKQTGNWMGKGPPSPHFQGTQFVSAIKWYRINLLLSCIEHPNYKLTCKFLKTEKISNFD
jgi:hypothetical protein